MTIRVLLVDDHQLVRVGLRALLETADDIEVVAEASDGAQALPAVAEHRPDVVLMDLSMPVMDGVEATRRLLADNPATQVVVLTSYLEEERFADAVAAGAIGYLLKDSEPENVLGAVRAAAAGHAPIDPRMARSLLPGHRAPMAGPPVPAGPSQRSDPPGQAGPVTGPGAVVAGTPAAGVAEADRQGSVLSLREREVLSLVAGGLANKQIARALGISDRTVKTHLANIFRNIGVADRTSAAMWARDHGIV